VQVPTINIMRSKLVVPRIRNETYSRTVHEFTNRKPVTEQYPTGATTPPTPTPTQLSQTKYSYRKCSIQNYDWPFVVEVMQYLVILLSSCRMHIHRLFDNGLCTLWTQIAFHRSLYKHTHTHTRADNGYILLTSP
jgi:hypothetical protein